VPPDARLPRSLFDSVADNLIRNALAKRSVDGPTFIRASLEYRGCIVLRVRDNGRAVPDDVAKDLLRAPVASRGGLGIGLYQAARQAEAAGYSLALESNHVGHVCFALMGPPV
jgi:sensor histidine kinase regulating citrate/malate metabolism